MAKGGSYTAKIGLDISDVDKKINSLSRELKTIDSDMKTNEKSTELLSQHYAVTAEKAQALAEKLKTLEGARSDVMAAFNAGQIDAEELRAYEREVESTRQALNDCIPVSIDFSKTFEVIGEAIRKATELTAAFVSESIQVGKAFESSMSQVAATMAIDKTSEDFAKLSEKAKDAGASTRYTASQAADALNYLALAGYSAEEAVTSLDKVLSLAQAGGMDLARASDMLTDTISALGLKKSDMDELIDKMAVTAQKTNTTVSMLGDALLQVGATARNIASSDGGVTELTTVLGVLANNGIKASEGGTHLRNIILKMSKPTKNTTALLEKLGMSFYDAEGKMRPLTEIFVEMKDKMDELGLTTQERDSLINKAFNPTDLASVNALLNTTAEEFDKLAGYINNSKDAAKDMGVTMENNLDGALRKMQSAKEAVQVELYEQIQEPLAKLASMAANALQETAEEIKDAQLAKEFNEALQKIADAAEKALPKVMELFKRFAEEVVPRLGEVAEKVIDITTDEVLPKLLDMFEWLMDHGNEVRTAIDMVVAAMAFDKVKKFTDGTFQLVGQLTTLTTQASAAGTAIGGATTSMAGQTAALTGGAGLISSLNLYALAIEGAVAVGLVLKDVIEQQTEKLKEQSQYWNGFTENSNATLDRYADMANTAKEDRKSAGEYKEQLDKDRQELRKLQDQLQILKKLGREAEKAADEGVINAWDAYNEYYREIGNKSEEQLEREIETLNNTISLERKYYDEQKEIEDEEQRVADQRRAERKYSFQKGEEYRKAAQKEAEAIEDAAKTVKGAEEKVQREAMNEFKAQLELETAQKIKSEEQANEEYIRWIENNLDEGTELYNTEMAKALQKREKFREDREKAEKKAADDAAKAEKDRITQETKDHENAVKAEKDLIKKKIHDAENTAKNEHLNDEELLQLKISLLEDYLKDSLEYEENRAEIEQQIEDFKADLNDKINKRQEKEREEAEKKRQDNLKKEWQRIDKTDLESQEKFLKSLSLADKELFDQSLQEYEDNLDDLIKGQEEAEQKYIDKGAAAAEKVVELYQKQTDSIAKMAESPVETFNEKTKKYEKAEQGTIYDAKTGKKRYIFANYQKKIQELKAYQANLERLKKLDLPQEMITDIFSMDFETRALYIKELLNMSAANREKYFRDYRTFYKTANEIGASEVDYAKKNEVQKIMDEAVRDMSEDQKYNGELAAKSWCEGFSEYMEKNGITLDVSKYTDTVGAYGAANPYAGAMTAEEMQTYRNGLTEVTSKLTGLTEAIGKGIISINMDGKNMFTGFLKDAINKSINISDKSGGVLA